MASVEITTTIELAPQDRWDGDEKYSRFVGVRMVKCGGQCLNESENK